MNDPDDRHRLDKWLWCTRFYKTRSLATHAVAGGRVKVNGERAKASRDLRVGDRLEIASGDVPVEVEVTGLPERRGPATQARACYVETPASIAARTLHQERQRIAAVLSPRPEGRPDKRDRRRLERFRRDNDGSAD
jgi:ribosome-associated heat shock protein Hsp15